MCDSPSATNPSMLELAKREDAIAWSRLDAIYRPKLIEWASKRGIQHADAEDLASEVLLHLFGIIKDFHYDPEKSFRGLLRTQLGFRMLRLWRDSQRMVFADTAIKDSLLTDDSHDQLTELILADVYELKGDVLLPVARKRCNEEYWRAYQLLAIDELSGEQTADRLGLKIGTAYVYAGRFRAELAKVAKEMDLL